jgi:hypothetical protein
MNCAEGKGKMEGGAGRASVGEMDCHVVPRERDSWQ